MLRRRLQEVTAAQWTDAVLNDYLNLGLAFMQGKIMEIDPLFVVYTDDTILSATISDYPRPDGCMFEIFLRISEDGGTTFSDPLIKADLNELYDTAETYDFSYSGEQHYARKGRFFRLASLPAADRANGLEITYVPTLSMGADTDVPDIHTIIHEGVVYRGEMIALGDTAEESVRAKEDLGAILESLPLYYHESAMPTYIKIDKDMKWDVQ